MNQFFKNLIIVILFIVAKNSFAQQKYAPTFLWKITGNGLAKPSYIYGTVHLQDKALFNLGDSIYSALEKSDGFSLEIDPVEIIDSMIKKIDENDQSPLVKDLFKDEDYKKIIKKIESKYKVKTDKLTLKKLYKYSTSKLYETDPKNKMQAFMDMYLYNIAMRQNKKFAPLENVSDQMNLINNFSPDNIEKLINIDSISEINYVDKLKSMYIKSDLTGLGKMVAKEYSGSFADIFLTKRNIKMTNRIDSISKIRTAFYAFGAAHLPGDSGIIKLLQNKGYNVEPILSSKNLKPEEYKYTAIERPWIKATDDDSLVMVELPLEPSKMNKGADINLKLCMDLTNNMFYGFGIKALSEENISVDSITARMLKNYKQTGYEIISHKKMTQNGYNGEEFVGRQNEKFIYRIRFLVNDKKMALQIFGVEDKKYLYEENSEHFFKSIKFTGNTNNKAWVVFENKENGYTVDMPKKPIKSTKIRSTEISTIDSYTSIDINDGTYYLVQTLMPKIGYFFQSDSEYYDGYKKQLEQQVGDTLLEFKKVLLNDIPGLRFAAKQKVDAEEIIMQGYILETGNCKNVLLVVSPTEKAYYPNVSTFFNSFKKLPYPKTTWQKAELKDEKISLWLPGEIEKIKKDSSSSLDLNQYYVQDKNTLSTYYLDVETESPYYWVKNDSLFYRSILNGYKKIEDSVYQFTYDSLTYKASMLYKFNTTNLYKKLDLKVNDNKIYILYSVLPTAILNREDELKYFSEFKFENKKVTFIFDNKIKLLTDSLLSSDSITASKALKTFIDIDFDKSDLPYLHNAFTKKYMFNNGEEDKDVNDIIAARIKIIGDTSSIDFVEKNYFKNVNKVENLQQMMAEILASIKNVKSYALLKSLILKSPPKSKNPYALISSLSDSTPLIKSLFPEVMVLFADTTIGAGLMQLANRLLDSNLLDKKYVLLNEKGILENANFQTKALQKNIDANISYSNEVIKMLGRLNTNESNLLLKKYFDYAPEWLKQIALMEQIKNNALVSPTDILKMATYKNYRTYFYDELKKIDKEKLFPKQYYTQQKFAESYVYSTLTGEYEMEEPILTLIGEKISKIKGKEKRFFIYKVKNSYDGDISYGLAIMGSFSKEIGKVVLDYKEHFFNYTEGFKQADINKIYNNFIKELNTDDLKY